METLDHVVPPVVCLEAEVEALVIHLSELAGNDVIAFLERLTSKMRVRCAVERHLN